MRPPPRRPAGRPRRPRPRGRPRARGPTRGPTRTRTPPGTGGGAPRRARPPGRARGIRPRPSSAPPNSGQTVRAASEVRRTAPPSARVHGSARAPRTSAIELSANTTESAAGGGGRDTPSSGCASAPTSAAASLRARGVCSSDLAWMSPSSTSDASAMSCSMPARTAGAAGLAAVLIGPAASRASWPVDSRCSRYAGHPPGGAHTARETHRGGLTERTTTLPFPLRNLRRGGSRRPGVVGSSP